GKSPPGVSSPPVSGTTWTETGCEVGSRPYGGGPSATAADGPRRRADQSAGPDRRPSADLDRRRSRPMSEADAMADAWPPAGSPYEAALAASAARPTAHRHRRQPAHVWAGKRGPERALERS